MEPNVATDPSLHPRTELPVDAVVVWNFREVRPRALEVPLESDGSNIEVPLESDGSDIEVPLESDGSDIEVPLESDGSDTEVPLESDGSDIEVPLETDGSDIGSRPSLEELQLKGARGFHIGHQITGN